MKRLNDFVPVLLVLVIVGLGFAWISSQRAATEAQQQAVKINTYWSQCQSKFNLATQQRSALITKYSNAQRAAAKKEHAAMTVLVAMRGEANSAETNEAKSVWLRAGREWEKATWMVDEANRLNPVLQFNDFCKPIKGVTPPKVPPAKKPDLRMYPGPQNPQFL